MFEQKKPMPEKSPFREQFAPMHDHPTIALDAMGGDYGPEVVVPAALDSLDRNPKLNLILVGDGAILKAKVASSHHLGNRLQYPSRFRIGGNARVPFQGFTE